MSSFGFDAAFLERLERLAVLNRRPLVGPNAGPRRSPRRGASVEFADFRDYAPGDDFRRIDWKAYARLDRLFLRLYSAEEMTTLTLFVDHSASMRFGAPSKALVASQLAAVFAYIALHNYDRVAVAGWGDRIDHFLPPQSGKASVPRVWQHIAEIMAAPAGRTDVAALADCEQYRRGPGLAIVLTDLLTDSDWRRGLTALRAGGQAALGPQAHLGPVERGGEVTLVQILAPEEFSPAMRGDWKLRDAERGVEVEITASSRLLRRYEEAFRAYTGAIQAFCRRQGMPFVQISSDAPVTDVVVDSLYAAGVVG